MCMGRNLGEVALKRYRAKGKNGYIRVWKCVLKQEGWHQAQTCNKRYIGGFYRARRDAATDNWLIHAFRDRKSAIKWGGFVVVCLVKPEWITAIGNAWPEKTLTTKAIVMPEFPKTKATVREFWAAVKGKKVKKYRWESK